MQSKKAALIETVINVGSGYIIGILTQLAVFPLLGIEVSLAENALLTLIFSISSLLRGYFIRRIANKVLMRKIEKKRLRRELKAANANV